MKLSPSKFLPVAAIALLASAAAIAQTIPVPTAPFLTPTQDLVPVIPLGQPQARSTYATSGQIAGAVLYQNLGVATTGNTYTYTSGQVYMMMQPSATLAAVTLITEANPSDGQRECFISTQTTTGITWTANTGQTVSGAPTAGVAQTAACMIYVKGNATWYRS